MPKARVHDVVVFGESLDPKYKVIARSYYVPKKEKAHRLFEKEFPENPVVKVLDLGIIEVEFSQEKYDALYKDA